MMINIRWSAKFLPLLGQLHRVGILSVVEQLGVNPRCSSYTSQQGWFDTREYHMYEHLARY